MKYGSLMKRVKAILIDMLIIVALGLVASSLISSIDNVPNYVKAIVFILIFLLYDPLCTSFLGGTIGHFIIGLRVRRVSDESQKVHFPVAILRFLIKVFLGSISLLTVPGNSKKRAIHDSIAGSVVIEV